MNQTNKNKIKYIGEDFVIIILEFSIDRKQKKQKAKKKKTKREA